MYYHARVERVSQWIKEALNNPGQKFYVETTRFQDIQTILGWDIPYFSILLSSLEPKQKTVSIFPLEEDNGNNLKQVTSDEYIFRNGEIEKIESLNKNYFRINQKSDAYKRLE